MKKLHACHLELDRRVQTSKTDLSLIYSNRIPCIKKARSKTSLNLERHFHFHFPFIINPFLRDVHEYMQFVNRDLAIKSKLGSSGNSHYLLKCCVEAGDNVLPEHLTTCNNKVNYTSHRIQNELI